MNNAITNQNLIVPAGTQKIGDTEYNVKLNASPLKIEQINDLPIRGQVGGNVTHIRDVAFVHDGHPPQTNIVRVNGRRAVLMTIQKTGAASTLNIVNEIYSRLPRVRELLPEGAAINATGDQSVFVRAAVKGVVMEAVIAACLTALMVLLFLGSWRSTLIIAISIPLSIICLHHHPRRARETINLMTLGGLALAVGILVDDATVTIENINRHLEQGQDVEPRFSRARSRSRFRHWFPLSLSVSCLSRCSCCRAWRATCCAAGRSRRVRDADFLRPLTYVGADSREVLAAHRGCGARGGGESHFLRRFQRGFEARFEKVRDSYQALLATVLEHRGAFIAGSSGPPSPRC